MEKQTWKAGKNGGCVVSDVLPTRTSYSAKDFESEKEYYGGYLIAESIPDTEKLNLIIAAPDLLEALTQIIPYASEWINDNHLVMQKAKQAIKKATEQ